jgi:hypothetical protein
MSNALENLTPEMKARLASIMAGNQTSSEAPEQPAVQAPAPPAPPVRPPSLMDHVIALRQEVAALRQEVANVNHQAEAGNNVIEAVGQAVGQLYQMFQPSPSGNAQGSSFSQGFQQSVDDSDY